MNDKSSTDIFFPVVNKPTDSMSESLPDISSLELMLTQEISSQGTTKKFANNQDRLLPQNELEERLEQRTAVLKATIWELRQEIARRASSEHAVREERNRFRTLVETIPHGILEFNLEGTITFANAEYHRIFGYPVGKLIGKNLDDTISSLNPNAQEYIERIIREQQVPASHSHRLRNYVGKIIDLKVDWNYKHDANGDISGFITINSDITNQRRLEAEAQQRLNQLAHVTRIFTMNQMVSGLAHELSQPLAAISNYAQACRHRLHESSGKLKHLLLESIEQISTQANRAGQIIRRLRDYVRNAESSRTLTNMNELVADVLDLMQIEARMHNINLQTSLADDLPQAIADRIQIEQVITNLIKNAMEATCHQASEYRRVIIQTATNIDGMLEIAVIDNGKGVDCQALTHVFEPFYTTKPCGLGLGLSISRSIVEDHGGRMQAANNPDGGMTFSFTLPVGSERGEA